MTASQSYRSVKRTIRRSHRLANSQKRLVVSAVIA